MIDITGDCLIRSSNKLIQGMDLMYIWTLSIDVQEESRMPSVESLSTERPPVTYQLKRLLQIDWVIMIQDSYEICYLAFHAIMAQRRMPLTSLPDLYARRHGLTPHVK